MHVYNHRIVESKNAEFKEGDYVVANFGWRTHTISNGENVYKLDKNMFTEQKLSTALGVLGMPGYVASYVLHLHAHSVYYHNHITLLLMNYKVAYCITVEAVM